MAQASEPITTANPRPARRSGFADAVAVWHLADLRDATGRTGAFTARGAVRVGVELSGAEREASLVRGGDGRVAEFAGGYLDAGQGTDGALNVKGNAFSLCARLRDPAGAWMTPLFSKHGGHDQLVYNLFAHDLGQGPVLGFELGTAGTRGMTQVFVPLALIGPRDWHDVICRYDGAKLQLFVDGVWMDEGFPVGPLRQGNREPVLLGAESVGGAVKAGWHGLVDHVALWERALTDSEVEALSGGATAVAAKRAQYLGGPPSMQYFRPHNQFNVGDTLPFFHEGTFHFLYLLDRGHHSAKGGQGAHQWAHASSRDLVHWTEHPLAVPITRPEEGSICTGSLFFHAGTYYAFYATRVPGQGEHLSLATSRDAIHFTKAESNAFLLPGAQYTRDFRDPHVFRDERTGLFHLLVSTMLKEPKRGCLAHYTSPDLRRWQEVEPFLIEGAEVPECPDYFQWNGWYYLVFSQRQVARYRLSHQPLGPWERPQVEVLDGGAARVMKTAAFTGNRRLGTASIWPAGYAGWAVFRELIQHDDGTLGTAWVPEMIPATGEPVALDLAPLGPGGTGDRQAVQLRAPGGMSQAVLRGVPPDCRIQLRVTGQAAAWGLRLRGADDSGGQELRFEPGRRRVAIPGGPALAEVAGLDRPLKIDLILKDHLLDVSVGPDRTLIHWLPDGRGDRLVLFAEQGEARFEQITVRPLR